MIRNSKLWMPAAIAVLALIAGCSKQPAETTEAAPEAAAPAAETPTAAPTEAEIKQAAESTQESAATADSNPGDASLERVAAMPESAQLPSGRWKPGVNYRPIVPAQATMAEPGQVEVLEILWLGCGHCYSLEPYMHAWDKKKAPYVKFVQEHVMWGPAHRAHARLFYTLKTLGRDDLVTKAFDEIHRRGNMLIAQSDAQSLQMQTAFATANGVSEADFKREYNGFAVNTRLQRAEELMRRYKIESVPRVVINGKYESGVEMVGSQEELVALINDLSASEKR